MKKLSFLEELKVVKSLKSKSLIKSRSYSHVLHKFKLLKSCIRIHSSKSFLLSPICHPSLDNILCDSMFYCHIIGQHYYPCCFHLNLKNMKKMRNLWTLLFSLLILSACDDLNESRDDRSQSNI